MNVKTNRIPVANNIAEIDVTDYKHIYIVKDNGEVTAVPLPQFGTLEISCQNYSVGNVALRATIKI